MKDKVTEFNLAEMNEEELIDTLINNRADQSELYAMLEAMFEMWAAAVRFSSVVVQYGEAHHDKFLETFVKHAGPQHGVTPDRLANVLRKAKQKLKATNKNLH